MPVPGVTTSTATPQRVVLTLGQLAVAYFERLAARDWARASVVLTVFSNSFNEHHDAIVRYVMENASNPTESIREIPARIPTTWSVDTRRALQIAILLYVGASIKAPVQLMPTTAEPTSIQAWWNGAMPGAGVKDLIPRTAFVIANAIADQPMASLAQNLQGRTDATIYGVSAEVIRDESLQPFDVPATPQGNEIFQIPGFRAQWNMPTWGWWAVGLGGVAAVGVIFWGVAERGWFR